MTREFVNGLSRELRGGVWTFHLPGEATMPQAEAEARLRGIDGPLTLEVLDNGFGRAMWTRVAEERTQ